MDWNSNPALARAGLQRSELSRDFKLVLKPCSVRVERCKLSSSSLVWGVEKVKLEDETVQLVYHGVRVREGDLDEGISDKKDEEQISVLLENSRSLSLKCPKCDQVFNDKRSLVCHTVSHYYQLFFKVLPNMKPFPCPICEKLHKHRVTLARHYAITHAKIYEMTDLTPEDLPGIKIGRKLKWSLINNNCPEKKTEPIVQKVVDGDLAEFEKNDKDTNEKRIEIRKETQPLDYQCHKCGKVFNNKRSMCSHVVSHYYDLLFKVLPNSKPFPCPSCGKVHRDRIGLARHYAFTHRKIFEMTDTTPEDLPGIGKGSGVKWYKSQLPSRKVLLNDNCPVKNTNPDEKVVDDGLVKSEKRDIKIELSDADDQMSSQKCVKSESIEAITVGYLETEVEMNMEISYPNTLPSDQGVTPAPSSLPDFVSQEQAKNFVNVFAAKDMDDDEFGDLSAPFL